VSAKSSACSIDRLRGHFHGTARVWLLAPKCAADGNTDLVIRGKPGPVLFATSWVGHPDRELTALAFDELGAHAQLAQVRSNDVTRRSEWHPDT
jgi:hypothetical protein